MSLLFSTAGAPFVLYTFRHTCITRWAKHMDPFTLHVLAGHTDMNTTKRYVHPSDADILEAMEKVRGGTKLGTIPKTPNPKKRGNRPQFSEGEEVRWSHPPGLNRRPADYEFSVSKSTVSRCVYYSIT